MGILGVVLGLLAGLASGLTAGYLWQVRRAKAERLEPDQESQRILERARQEADRIRSEAEVEAQEKIRELKAKVTAELDAVRADLANQQRELTRKEEELKRQEAEARRRQKELERRAASLKQKEDAAAAAAKAADKALAEARALLEETAGLTAEQALERLKEQVVDEARAAAAAKVKEIEEEAAREAEARSKRLLVAAIQRYAGEYVAERTVTVVELPGDDMKGRIIGREGRNIRTFEAATGVDVVIDDTPEAVLLSCFNPIRREVARLALTRLVADGRIHPARIEDVVARCETEVQGQCKEAGEQAVFDLGIHKMHPELIRLLGSLKFRSAYGQNLLRHSVEVGFLAGLLAAEVGLNAKIARRAGLLHDIGKALDQNAEGSHAEVGAELAKKYGESPEVVHAIAAHHEEVPAGSLLDVIVQTANTLSARRPGARKEMLETFVKRLDALEKLAKGMPGVKKAFAIQAGREIRVVVSNEKMSDEQSVFLAKDLAARIEEEMTYPGQVRVHVLRESRFTETAK